MHGYLSNPIKEKKKAIIHGYYFHPLYNRFTNLTMSHLSSKIASSIMVPSIPHVVVVPVPLQGHINPMFHFAKAIACKGVIVTFVNTESVHAEILRANKGIDPFKAAAESMGADIRSVQVSDGLPLNFDRYLNRDDHWETMRVNMAKHMSDLMSKLVKEDTPVTCMVVDTFYVWTAEIARQFGIPFASFYTESVAVYSIYTHWELLQSKNHLPYPQSEDENESIIDYVPGLPAMKLIHLPSFLQESHISTPLHKIIKRSFEIAREAKWVLSNTVDELEMETVCAMKELGIRFMSVGPILQAEFKEKTLGTSVWKESDECLTWLDSQQKESVVYISFGSYSRCTKELIHEVAMGIVESKKPFIWVLRPDVVASGVDDVLPEGFEERTKEQGMVVKWCNQLSVLRHPAVGAFVTHGGWNSIMEGLWIGVPMMTFPLLTDQYTNGWLMADRLGLSQSMGTVKERSRQNMRSLVCGHDVAKSIVEFLEPGVERSRVKEKVEWAKDTVRRAVLDPHGSSSVNLSGFIQDVNDLCNRPPSN